MKTICVLCNSERPRLIFVLRFRRTKRIHYWRKLPKFDGNFAIAYSLRHENLPVLIARPGAILWIAKRAYRRKCTHRPFSLPRRPIEVYGPSATFHLPPTPEQSFPKWEYLPGVRRKDKIKILYRCICVTLFYLYFNCIRWFIFFFKYT